MTWLLLSLIALVFFGLQKFLFKVVAEKNLNVSRVMFFFMLTVSVLAFVAFITLDRDFSGLTRALLLLAAGNAMLFLFLSLSRIEALKLAPSIVAIPIFDLSFLLIVPISILFFGDSLSLYDFLIIILGILSGFLLANQDKSEQKKYPQFAKGVLFALIAMLFSVSLNAMSKFIAVGNTHIFMFMTLSYLFNTLILHLQNTFKTKSRKIISKGVKEELFLGVAIGIANFLAFWANLEALRTGSVVLVGVVISFSSIFAIVLTQLLYKEKVTQTRLLAVACSVVALILMQFRP